MTDFSSTVLENDPPLHVEPPEIPTCSEPDCDRPIYRDGRCKRDADWHWFRTQRVVGRVRYDWATVERIATDPSFDT